MSSVKRLRRRAVFNRAALCCSDSSTGYARLRVEHGVVDLLAIGSCLPWSPHRGVPPLLSGCLHTVPIVDRFAGQPCDGGHCEAGSVCQFALMQNERPPRAWLAGVRGTGRLFLILALLSSADGRVRRGARGVPHAPLHPQLARRIEGSIVDHRARFPAASRQLALGCGCSRRWLLGWLHRQRAKEQEATFRLQRVRVLRRAAADRRAAGAQTKAGGHRRLGKRVS